MGFGGRCSLRAADVGAAFPRKGWVYRAKVGLRRGGAPGDRLAGRVPWSWPPLLRNLEHVMLGRAF